MEVVELMRAPLKNPCRFPTEAWGDGERVRLRVEKYWVLSQSEEKCLRVLLPSSDPIRRSQQ